MKITTHKRSIMEHLTKLFYSTNNAVSKNRQIYLNKSVEEKRTLYRCKQNYVKLEEIPTWPEYCESEKVPQQQSI